MDETPLSANDIDHIQQAYRRFKYLVSSVTKDNDEHVNLPIRLAREIKEKKAAQLPFSRSHCTVHGIEFQVMMLREVDDLLMGLQWGPENGSIKVGPFPSEASEGYFLVASESVRCDRINMGEDDEPDDLDIAGYLFLKDLVIDGPLLSLDTDTSPFFVVKGDLTAENIGVWGNTHYVGGNLKTNLLYGKYNHGSLFVAGAISCQAVVSVDFEMFVHNLNCWAIVAESDRVSKCQRHVDTDGDQHFDVVNYPPTHDLHEILLSEVLSEAGEDDSTSADEDFFDVIYQYMQAGKAIIDLEKIRAPIESFRENVIQEMAQLFELQHFRENKYWMLYPRAGKLKVYFFAVRQDDGTQSLSLRNEHHFYKLMVMVSQPTPKKSLLGGLKNKIKKPTMTIDVDLSCDHYEKDNDTEKIEFDLTPEVECLEVYQVMYAFRKGLSMYYSAS